MTDYRLVERLPTVAEYRDLRRLSGLSEKSPEAAERGLPATLFAVVIEADGGPVGMGRVIGDGGTAYQVVDIAVLPPHQGQGLGKRIVAALVDWLHATAPKSAYVSLIADGPAKDLYAQYGFEPTAPASIGMAFKIK
ncbi:MAG: GNAT family N-acetyltransferase [Devosia sp.]|jgi:GNAT superfamily N-acetyltransferase|uniref:GNAT family N-acetyltransferase n=1 Tax=Devosia sp. 66-22 TaxID=1895753 RepID=UPI00092B33F0|nr:GNAT family N-acetyltransferase [Devosia sp. 66-22]MBN9348992.1 GNAT family N-acetyltransferase [Devosia sp.]OJX50401.1 MAG: N-acetyltransferase [Devosia sp. 66-22]